MSSYGVVASSPDGVRGGSPPRQYIFLGSAVFGFLFVMMILFM